MHINAFESIYVTGLGGPEVEDLFSPPLYNLPRGTSIWKSDVFTNSFF